MSEREILVLNGPNLNLLGRREPHVYGADSLTLVTANLDRVAAELGVTLAHVQSNHEGALVDAVHAASGGFGAIVNAGAYAHTSVALRDALLGVGLPFVEVHISNTAAREPFRHRSYLADIAIGSVVGLGTIGYELALRGLVARVGGTGPGSEV